MAVVAAPAVSKSEPGPKKGKSRSEVAEPAVPTDEPEAKKGKSRTLLIAGAIVALVALGGGIGGGVSYFYARSPAADSTKAADKTAEKAPDKATEKAPAKAAEKAPEKAPEHVARKAMLYVPMETFTVNLRNSAQERYLQTTINLEVADKATAESIKDQMPSIRNRVLLMLSSKEAEELMTREGKEKLSAEIGAELRKSLDGAGPGKGLEQVLFSNFVIQ